MESQSPISPPGSSDILVAQPKSAFGRYAGAIQSAAVKGIEAAGHYIDLSSLSSRSIFENKVAAFEEIGNLLPSDLKTLKRTVSLNTGRWKPILNRNLKPWPWSSTPRLRL